MTTAELVFFGDSLTDNGNLFALAGVPKPPYVNGIFSNGPTYAAPINLPALLNLSSANYAFGGARAHGTRVINHVDTNLGGQIKCYLKTPPAAGATAVINIGSNDYLNYNPATDGDPVSFVTSVIGAIGSAINDLHLNGVDHIVLYTLPNPTLAPIRAGLTPVQIAGANAIVSGHNGGIEKLALIENALGVDTHIVDLARLQLETYTDRETFGFFTTKIPFVHPVNGTEVPTGIVDPAHSPIRPDQVAFFDEIHPSAAAHGVIAAFSAASLTADKVLLSNFGNQTVSGGNHDDLVFTGRGDDHVYAAAGNDTVFAGTGNDFVSGGAGNDIIAGGGGNDALYGGLGSDVLAGNLGNDKLYGGAGSDILISGQGTDLISGGAGNDLMFFKHDFLVPGQDAFFGGHGTDTLRIIVSDYALSKAQALIMGDFQQFAFNIATHHAGSMMTLGLSASNVERVEIYMQSHVDNSLHELAAAGSPAIAPDAVLTALLHKADLWGLL
jgi:phospholipase/lecithinase/hemolysin